VNLDHNVADFYFELMAWVRRRESLKPMRHFTEAPKHLNWPEAPYDRERMDYRVGDRHKDGIPYLEWKRLASDKVDPKRCLLATSRYADEEPQTLPATATGQKIVGEGSSGDTDAAAFEGGSRKVRPRQAKRKSGGGDVVVAKKRASRRSSPA
jgi:hypothetical protein